MLGSLWHNPRSIRYTCSLIALYLHFGPFSRYVAQRTRAAIAREKSGPVVRPAAEVGLAASG